MGGYFFPTQEDYDSYEGFDYSDPLGVNKLKKEETPNFLGSLMNWADKYEYEGTHDIDPITGEVSKKSLPGILGGVVGDLFSIPKRGVDYVTSKASGLEETRPAEEILTNALFPKYDSAPIADNLLKPFIESVPGGALVTAHDNLSKLKKNDFKPISDAADVTENALRGASRTGGSLLLDPTLWAGINAPGALGTGIGAYFGVEGAKGAAEKLGESYSQAFDQGKPTEAIEPFIEALGLGYLGKTGLEHSSRELAKTLPEIKLGGGYSTRSPINLESSPAPRQIPNFASAMADGKAPSSEAPSFITDLLEPDSLIKRRDELKDLGVLVNPTGRVPRTESLYHGTGNEWGVDPTTGEFNPFSSRKASSGNLHGGPFYLTDAMPVAEGSYAAAGEGEGPNPEIINADVTTNKTWNLDAPVPRDIRVKGLTLLNKLAQNAENPQQANYYRKAYDRLKQARIGRDVESIMSDVADRTDSSLFNRYDPSGLHITQDKSGRLIPKGKELPLRQRLNSSGKDRFLQVLESDLGYDSVKHGSRLTGGEVTIPFSRSQIKTRGAQKLSPLSERSIEGLVAEYSSLDPSKEANKPLLEALESELEIRGARAGFIGSGNKWSPEYYDRFKQYLESQLDTIPEFDRTDSNARYVNLKDQLASLESATPSDRQLLSDFRTKKIGQYERIEPVLTPEDEALLKTPLYESLENPTTRISESKTPETTDVRDWLEEGPKEIQLGKAVDKIARALGYQDLPTSTSNIQGESLSESAKFIQSQKRKYGKEWETKQTQSEGDYLRKLLSRELSGETVSEKPPTVIQNREPGYEEVDPEVEALRDSISEKSPYEMVGKTPPEKSSLDKSIEKVVAKRPPKTPVPKEVDLEGASTKKTAFQVSLSNGKVYTVKANDDISAREQVQDLIDKHGSKFNITDVKPKYSKLESDLITSANPTEERLATRAGKEVSKEEVGSQKWEESQRQKAQLAELRDQLKVERQKAQAGDKEAKLREKAIEQEIKDKLKVEKQFRDAEAKRKQQEFQAKVAEEGSWKNSLPIKAGNTVKLLRFGYDLGHFGSQGYQMGVDLLTSKHAGKALKSIPETFRFLANEKYFTKFHEDLAKDSDIKLLTEKFGLDLPGVGKGLKEEVFYGPGWFEKLPVVGKTAKAFERAYTGGLNYLRAASAKKFVGELKAQGKTPESNPEAYRGVARAINILGRRGDFSPKWQARISDASFAFGAPRNAAAKYQNLIELARGGTSANIVRRSAAKMLVFNAGILALLQANRPDGEVVLDPQRTDFGKFRDKNITVDLFAGFGSPIRTGMQTIMSLAGTELKSPHSGKEYPVAPINPYVKHIVNMISPGIRAAFIATTGRDMGSMLTGVPKDGYLVDRWKALSELVPMSAEQIKDILEESDGLEKIIYSAMQYAGVQVNTFNPKKAKAEQERLKKERGLKPSKKPKSSSGTVNYKEFYNF